MPYFVVYEQHFNRCSVVEGENVHDALYHYAKDGEEFNDAVEKAGGVNAWAEHALATTYHCTEIHRAMILEYVERRLDGDVSISIML